MARNRRTALFAALTVLATLVIGGTAFAQPYPGDTSEITCDTTIVQPGSTFTCSAGGFDSGTDVYVTATGSTTDATGADAQAAAGTWTYNTTVKANNSGVATATIQVPGDAVGPVSVTFEGISNGQARVLSAVAVVTVAAPPAGAPGDGAPDGDADGDQTAATGNDFTTGIIAVTALLVIGGGLLFATRRRHHIEV